MDTSQFFEQYYNHAEVNAILIMDAQGQVMDINRSFSNNFKYAKDDIVGRHFSMLFNQKDREDGKPEKELSEVTTKGQSHDENYILSKDGVEVWCTGESIRIQAEDGVYIVKDIINLQAKKELHLFLTDTEELLERIFAVSDEIPMMVLSSTLRVQHVNGAFLRMFSLQDHPRENSRLFDLKHPFWHSDEIRQSLMAVVVSDLPMKNKPFSFLKDDGKWQPVRISSKSISSNNNKGKRIFIIIDE